MKTTATFFVLSLNYCTWTPQAPNNTLSNGSLLLNLIWLENRTTNHSCIFYRKLQRPTFEYENHRKSENLTTQLTAVQVHYSSKVSDLLVTGVPLFFMKKILETYRL